MTDPDKIYYTCPKCGSQVWVYLQYPQFVGRPCLSCQPVGVEDIRKAIDCTIS